MTRKMASSTHRSKCDCLVVVLAGLQVSLQPRIQEYIQQYGTLVKRNPHVIEIIATK
jgi:hypothetical protein